MNYMFNIVMCLDTCEPTCFKLAMMLNTTTLYSLIPVWMTLMFIQGHNYVQQSCLFDWLAVLDGESLNIEQSMYAHTLQSYTATI